MNDHADMSAAVAIVGMAGRFPAAPDLDTFWENLVAGRDSISRFSEGELRASGVQPETFRSSRYVPSRSVLDGPGAFDAAFFGIGRREAELMDPQHRLFLECVWEALESAGYDLHRREGLVGLFGGSTMSTYYTNNIQRSAGAEQWPDWFQAWTGNDKEYLVTRAGYHLNLKGPCICVQSACSTSLVAVHQGVAALLSRECDLALAGGVTLRTPQRVGYLFEEGGIFSPDGHCKPFDERADGTVFGDGCGVVALRRLEEALADGDQVRAVILGTSVNNDGAAKVGFTAPSAPAQVRLITEALAVAGLDGLAVDYVEAHGTGTALGDALELQALGEALQADRRETACYVGSVKGNVGHLECAAGVAGLIKTVLMLERKKILPTAHFSALNHAAPQTTGLKVCEQLIDWPIGKRPRCAGVTSLGIGGTNAHIVLQEAPPSTDARLELRDHVFVHPVSARSSAALVEAVQRHARRVAQAATERQLGDVAYAAAMRRTHHPFRVAAAGANKAELLAELERTASALSDQEPTAAGELPRRVFVFSGQGSQWLGMGLDLRSQSAVFRRKIEEVDEVLKPRAGGASVLELLRGRDDEAIERMDRVQPALFAIATAYVELWKELGVEADAVVGHSMGEVAAAHVAGILSLEDAAVLITARSRLFHERCRPGGSMAMVELGDEAIATFLEAEPQVSVAANNGRRSTVISGESGAVRRLMETFEELGVYCRDVKVQYAAHSPMVEPMREALVDALSGIRPQRARIPMLSTTTLDFLEGPEAGPDYWARNLREPVRFAAAIRQLSSGGDCAFFELAPHPILQPFVESELREEGERGICVGTESRKATGRVALLRSLCRAYQAGLPVHWQRLQAPDARHTTLPHYPWQREQFWVDPDMALAARTAVEQETHPSLGRLDARLAHAGVWSWERRFSLESEPVFVDHVVAGANIAPGSLFIEIALAAAVECGCARELRALDLREVLRFEPDSDTVVQTSVRELTGGGFDLSISSRVARDAAEQGAEPWIVHATARLSSLKSRVAPAMNWEASVAGCDQKVEAQGYYAQLRAMDLQYGPGFRALQS
ncbi:MAG: type I polyketide synthase, partial [Myxococcales bacterium]|nr:type I polyketide synthase [Myxococcales bacterium]